MSRVRLRIHLTKYVLQTARVVGALPLTAGRDRATVRHAQYRVIRGRVAHTGIRGLEGRIEGELRDLLVEEGEEGVAALCRAQAGLQVPDSLCGGFQHVEFIVDVFAPLGVDRVCVVNVISSPEWKSEWFAGEDLGDGDVWAEWDGSTDR